MARQNGGHTITLFCLEHQLLNLIGIQGRLLEWLKSYLRDRYMTVRVGNQYSDRDLCSNSVPQGGAFTITVLDLHIRPAKKSQGSSLY
ncbi:hypothetical protein COOONC_28012 [Cooperia oncophora]